MQFLRTFVSSSLRVCLFGAGLGFLTSVVTTIAADQDTRLAEASAKGDRAEVRSLIRQKADVNATLPDGNTALHFAAQRGDGELVSLLVAAGANASVSNRYGVTPLVEAAANPSGPVAAMLLRAGASPKSATVGGETPLMTAARYGNLDAAKALIEAGADVNATESTRDQTALMWAAGTGHPAVIKLLAEHGADVSRHDRTIVPTGRGGRGGGGGGGGGRGGAPTPTGGMTALLFASRQGHLESVKVLLDAGAKVNETDAAGWTPMLLAISNTHYETAVLLMERGADLNQAEPGGRGPLYVTVDMHTIKPASAKPIRPEFDKLTSVQLAAALVARGADPNAKLAGGDTPFLQAAAKGDAAMMRTLLDGTADLTQHLDNGNTALMLAAGLGRNTGFGSAPSPSVDESIEVITLCLAKGMDINAVNAAGETALHGAARNGADAIVKLLVEKGATIDVKNLQGFTPLDFAAGKGAPPGRGGVPAPIVVQASTVALLQQLAGATAPRLPN